MGISLASSLFTAGNVLPNALTVNTGGNTHLYASKQAGGKNQKQQQKKKQQSRKAKKQSRKSSKKSRKSRQSRKN